MDPNLVLLPEIQGLINQAIKEDLPNEDVTTRFLKQIDRPGVAQLVAKSDLVISGLSIFEASFKKLAPETQFHWKYHDGDFVLNRQIIGYCEGPLLNILTAERTALNFLGLLSGVATLTRGFVEQTRGTDCIILDTRKTIPGWRLLQKNAVRDGGGHNHRMNLSEAILIKENHIRLAGSIRKCVELCRSYGSELSVEVEVSSLQEAQEAVQCGVAHLLLDNMNNETLANVRSELPSGIFLEASGNMTIERIQQVAQLGINAISVGALTHSAPTADMSMLFDF